MDKPKIQFRLSDSEIKRHIIIWFSIVAVIMILDPVPGGFIVNILGAVFAFGNYILLYYMLALYILPKIYHRQHISFCVRLCLMFVLYLIIKYARVMYILPAVGGKGSLYDDPIILFIFDGIIQALIIGSSAYVLYLSKVNQYKLIQQRKKEELNIKAELLFLKEQFNTHLTFNFLNYCYGHLNKCSKKATQSIEVFSEILEYSLTIKSDTLVPLRREIEYLENFISLQKIISSDMFFDFKYNIEYEGTTVPPMMLVDFLEIAFIKGQINRPSNPLRIKLNANEKLIVYTVECKLSESKNPTSTFNKEQNLKNNLDLYYKDMHEISFSHLNKNYIISATINLT